MSANPRPGQDVPDDHDDLPAGPKEREYARPDVLILGQMNEQLRKRRWLGIGPGIVIALIISAFIGVWHFEKQTANNRIKVGPIIENRIISSSEDKYGPTPEVGFIIDRSSKLGISAAQLAGLKALQSKWQRDYAPEIAELNKAAAKANDFFASAKRRSATSMAEIQKTAGPVVALSREIAAARLSYWDKAIVILTPAQRKLIQSERAANWKTKAGCDFSLGKIRRVN